jgi:hypothetical protein
MQMCVFHKKNYSSTVEGLVAVAGWLRYFSFLFCSFLFFPILFSF